MAVVQHFGEQVDLHPVLTLEDVFHEVENESADYGLVPFEETLEALLHTSLTICLELISPNDKTRFIVLSHRQKVEATGADKTSLLILSPLLQEILELFIRYEIKIKLITPLPHPEDPSSYYYFIDIEGHQEGSPIKALLVTLKNKSLMVKVLGSYPTEVM